MSKTLEQILTPLVKPLIPLIDRTPEVLVFWMNDLWSSTRVRYRRRRDPSAHRHERRDHPTATNASLTVILVNGLAVEIWPSSWGTFNAALREMIPFSYHRELRHTANIPDFGVGSNRGRCLGFNFAYWDYWHDNDRTPWGTWSPTSGLLPHDVIDYLVKNANRGWSIHSVGGIGERWIELPEFELLKERVDRLRYERERRAEDARLIAEAEREAEREGPIVIRRKKFEW